MSSNTPAIAATKPDPPAVSDPSPQPVATTILATTNEPAVENKPVQETAPAAPAADTDPTPTPAAPATKDDRSTPGTSLEIDTTKPSDFDGEVATTDEIPSPDLIKQIEDFVVLDKDGKTHTFKSLYSGTNVARRVLIVFVRHFFCGVRPHSPTPCPAQEIPTNNPL